MSQIRSILLIFVISLITLVASLLAFCVFAPFLSPRACDGLIRAWAKSLLWVSGVKVKVRGEENLKNLKSVILVSNHLSLFDIPCLFSSIPLSFRMAAKKELFKVPFFGRAIASFGFFPVERDGPDATGVLNSMARSFNGGVSVWMAPEGTRQMENRIGPFKMGAFLLALKADQDILPVVICGTQSVLPKNSCLVNWSKWHQDVVIDVGQPVRVKEWSMEKKGELRDHVRTQMQATFDQLKDLVQ